MIWQEITVGEFLKNREERFKPYDKIIKSLRRIDKIDFSGQLFLSNKLSNTDMILIRKNDLVISGINVEKGAMCIYENEEDITATIHYSSYEIDRKKIDVDFLKLFLISPEFKDAIKEQVPGGIKTEIKPRHLLPLKIVIPKSLNEQKEIVLKFNSAKDTLLNAFSEFKNQSDFIVKLRQQILQDAIQGKLVSQDSNEEPASVLLEKIKAEKEKLIKEKKIKKGKVQTPEIQDELLFEIPQNWCWVMMDELTMQITDGTHQTPTYTSNGKMFLSAQNIKPFKFMPEEHKFISEKDYKDIVKNRQPERGDLLVARVGAGIGETAVINKDLEFAFYVSLGLVKPFKKYLYSDYLALVFNSPYGIKYSKGNISSKGGSAGNFNLGRIRSFLIPLPPLNEQKKIVKAVWSLIATCNELEKEVKQNQSLTQQLLQSALKEALEPKVN